MNRTIGILLLLAGIFMLITGFTNPSVVDAFNVYHMATGSAILMGILMSMKGKGPITATYIARIVVGTVFVVSGLIKANDTVGFAYKLEEYFTEESLGAFWASFHDYALLISVLVTGVEVVLGLALLFGIRARLTSIVLLLMTLFFGWLTYYTATCNEQQMAAISAGESFDRVCVTDCGCFGDALRGSVGRSLTPWESFYKDLTLFFMVLVLVVRSRKFGLNSQGEDFVILPFGLLGVALFGGWLFGWFVPLWFLLLAILVYVFLKNVSLPQAPREWILAGAMFILAYGFAVYTLRHLPVKDYRPYAVGDNLRDQMKSAEELGKDPTVYATIYTLENKDTGETKTMNSKDYLAQEIWKDKSWEIVQSSDQPVVIERGYEPPIASFSMTDYEGNEVGDSLLNDPGYSLWVVSWSIDKASAAHQKAINELANKMQDNGYNVVGLTSSAYETTEEYRHEHQTPYPYHMGDAIQLKTIVRSNPGLVLLKDGTVLAKWHHNDVPSFKEIREEFIQ